MSFTRKLYRLAILISVIAVMSLFAANELRAAASGNIETQFDSTSVIARVERLKRTSAALIEPKRMEAAWSLARIEELRKKSDEESLPQEKRMLERLIRLYQSYLAIIADTDDVTESETGTAWADLQMSPPYSIHYYDRLRRERESIRERIDNSMMTLKLRADEAGLRVDLLRKSEYAVKTARPPGSAPSSRAKYEALLLANESDQIMLLINLARIDIELDYIENMRGAFSSINSHLVEIAKDVDFPDEALEEIVSGIETSLRELDAEMERVTEELRLMNLEVASLVPDDQALISRGVDERSWRNEIYSSAWTSRENARLALWATKQFMMRYKLYTLGNEVNILSNSIHFWRIRQQVINGTAKGNDFWQARREALISIEDMNLEVTYAEQNMEDLRFAVSLLLASLNKVEDQNDGADEISALIGETMNILHSSIGEVTDSYESTMEDFRLLAGALAEETTKKMTAARFSERAKEVFVNLKNSFMTKVVWSADNFEVTAYDISRALMVVVVGYFISVLLSDLIGKIATAKSAKGQADARFIKTVKKASFALLWITFFMFALDSINVPLTAFAFLGGSLAIAVGFGAQDICKNLISGVIILFNRPFKAGDIIDVDNMVVTVAEVGPRCTTVTTPEAIEVVVPNSYFIANKVINYTKTTPVTRQSFSVTVSSECSTASVERVALDVMKDYRGMKSGQVPFVTLNDVSRDANTYMLYFWLDVKDYNSLVVKGKLREEIISRFSESGITLYQPEIYRKQ